MASTTQRYPLSTPEGVAIPLDVIKPHSLMLKAFLAASATAALPVPTDVEIMSMTATEDCLICFGGAAAVPADGVAIANTLLVEAFMRVSVAPKAATFTVIGLSANGTVAIQFIDKWAGLAVQTQYTKR